MLRAALSGPYPEVRRAAARVVRRALLRYTMTADRAAALGLPLSTYHALRSDFPEVFNTSGESTEPGEKSG